MERSSSSKAARVRTAWFPILVDVKGTVELNIGWKYTDGTIGSFSDTGKKKNLTNNQFFLIHPLA